MIHNGGKLNLSILPLELTGNFLVTVPNLGTVIVYSEPVLEHMQVPEYGSKIPNMGHSSRVRI